MPRTLMVDVDGVLIRGRPDDGRPWSADLHPDLGLRAEDLHREFFVPHWHDIVVGRADLVDRLVPVLAVLAPHLTAAQLVDYWFERDARVDGALLSDLAHLRNRGTGIHLATNQDHRRAAHIMQVLGLCRHVDRIHYSAALGCRKPDPAFFHVVASQMRCAPGELVLIDDFPDNVAAAKAAGWAALHWTGEKSLPELLASLCGQAACD